MPGQTSGLSAACGPLTGNAIDKGYCTISWVSLTTSWLSLTASGTNETIQPVRGLLHPLLSKRKIPNRLEGILCRRVAVGLRPDNRAERGLSPLIRRCKVDILQRFTGDAETPSAPASSATCSTRARSCPASITRTAWRSAAARWKTALRCSLRSTL